MATILVTGGAGYVGAHCCLALSRAGHVPVVYDNLSQGHAQFVKWGPLERGDILDRARLDAVFAAHKPAAVLHCASLIDVAESVREPARYYEQNVMGALTVMNAMQSAGVRAFVMSSTCAIYGEPQRLPLDEDHPQNPVNPYGWTKLLIEQMSRDLAAANGLRFAHLRYFNAAGACPHEGIGERHEPETHALPLALFTLLGRRDGFHVFGREYPTRDGTCLRDYVHALDLADAHVRAIDRLLSGGESLAANLGSGTGMTVLELLDAIERVTGRRVPAKPAPPRSGDPAALLADISRAQRELNWRPERDIEAIIADAWRWHADVEPSVLAAVPLSTR